MSEEEFYRWLGLYLKNIRRSCRLTQSDICQKYHLSRSSLSNIETGRHHLSIYALYELLIVLDDSFENILESMLALHRKHKF
ncbi:helix-turn-helix transcriptional regulator [Paenibacillus sp. NEAU-GSW1]|uniref:helix-turn-helix domain-containing protein n=1 Tax=Paenibacillus sp. NEAU-GSW1 TaxID=2682486 RepID=UPI0012E18520|nr:helix-turn-helix domain-containing protein [Paenibacillus sp. NEAU-GSW1]